MFEEASRLKLRFNTEVGQLSYEDLWDLSLTGVRDNGVNLNNIAKSLSKQVKADDEEDFVTPRTTVNRTLNLKFDIVKHIIRVKMEERDEAADKVAAKARKQQILAILADKEADELKGKTAEELKAML